MKKLLSFVLLIGYAAILNGQEKPNFVWLISEDNSKHYLELYQDGGAKTPNIANLARHGLIYQHAFSNAPVCSVARTTLMTGAYAPRIGTQFHRKMKTVPLPEGLEMFPAYLRAAGYYTTNKVKKDYNAIEGPNVWDESSRKASWRNRSGDQAFFHMQSFGDSHESRLHFSDSVFQHVKTHHDPDKVDLPPYFPSTPLFKYTYARYLDRMQIIDRQIGEVVKQLEEDGLLENTFIFYFGDHGGVLPRSKGYVYESGLHIPLVVRIPEKYKSLVPYTSGTNPEAFVSFIDFGPTLLHLAGLDIPSQMDGKPFLGQGLLAEDLESRDETYGYADRFDEKYDLVRTIRKGRFKYMRNYQPFNIDGLQNNYRYKMLAFTEWRDLYEQGTLNPIQRQFFESRPAEALYDIKSDPHETINIANNPEFKEVLITLRTKLQDHIIALPDLSLFPEPELVDHVFTQPVQNGQERKKEIERLLEIADYQLLPFKRVKKRLRKKLEAKSPWERYWALVVCTSFGKEARAMRRVATRMAKRDRNMLVRTRAAEFLALHFSFDPQKVVQKALARSSSGPETCLILNSVVLMQDVKGIDFGLNMENFTSAAAENNEVQRRIDYLLKE